MLSNGADFKLLSILFDRFKDMSNLQPGVVTRTELSFTQSFDLIRICSRASVQYCDIIDCGQGHKKIFFARYYCCGSFRALAIFKRQNQTYLSYKSQTMTVFKEGDWVIPD